MYQASTVFTGSEIPALIGNGDGTGTTVVGCCAIAGRHRAVVPAASSQIVVRLDGIETPSPSKLSEQAAKALDAILDTAAAQRVPDDSLVRRHAIDAEFALQHVE